MNPQLMNLLARYRYMAPVADDGGAGGKVDRGDDFVPTTENEGEAAKATPEELEAERAKLGLAAGKEKTEEGKEKTEEDKTKTDDGKDKAKDTRIPLSRHQEILAKERETRQALEVELANTKKGQAVAQTNEEIAALETKIVSLETQYTELMAEGKTKEATAVMKQIRESERTVTETKAEFRSQAAIAQAVETMTFRTTVERLEAAYPTLNPKDESYDEAKTEEVLELMSAYQLKGYAASAALQKAVGILMPAVTKKQESATVVTPRVTDAEAAAAVIARETEARKRNAEAANATPPALGKAGANSDEAGGLLDAKTAIKLSPEAFAKLTDSELARMRGDTV